MEQFLSVMAVLDEDTQRRLRQLQDQCTQRMGPGTQTAGIPFHITLGSYPVEAEEELVERIRRVCAGTAAFPLRLVGLQHFGDRVQYVEPEECAALRALREQFANDYPQNFPWVPHATLYCDDEQRYALEERRFSVPIQSRIVGIELGKFPPKEKIIRINF